MKDRRTINLVTTLTSAKFEDTHLITKVQEPNQPVRERILYYDKGSEEYVVLEKKAGQKFRKEIIRNMDFDKAYDVWTGSRQLTIQEGVANAKENIKQFEKEHKTKMTITRGDVKDLEEMEKKAEKLTKREVAKKKAAGELYKEVAKDYTG